MYYLFPIYNESSHAVGQKYKKWLIKTLKSN